MNTTQQPELLTYTDPCPGMKGDDIVTSHCSKCAGKGLIRAFGNIYGGVCFDCNGDGVIRRKVRNIRAAERRFVRQENAHRTYIAEHAEEIARAEAERQAAEKAEAERLAAEEAAKASAPEGRVEIVGKWLALKAQESAFGTTLKMLVESPEGWRVWGTAPAALLDSDAQKGDMIAFTATVERSRDDRTFGFFKRPTKARKA